MPSFLEKKLTKAWKNLFDKSTSGGYLPDYLPTSYSVDINMGKDLRRAIPSIGNLLLNNLATGNAYGHLGTVNLTNLNEMSIPRGGGDVRIGNNSTSVTLQIDGIGTSGYWQVSQKVNSWTTKLGFIPWREERTQYFKGLYKTTIKGTMTVNIQFSFPTNPDAAPTSEVSSLGLNLDRIMVNFEGNDSDSELLATVTNLFQIISDFINDKVQAQVKSRLQDNNDIKSKIKEKLDEGMALIWNEPI